MSTESARASLNCHSGRSALKTSGMRKKREKLAARSVPPRGMPLNIEISEALHCCCDWNDQMLAKGVLRSLCHREEEQAENNTGWERHPDVLQLFLHFFCTRRADESNANDKREHVYELFCPTVHARFSVCLYALVSASFLSVLISFDLHLANWASYRYVKTV